MQSAEFHLKLLKKEFERRQGANPRYSLRAYARDLALDPGLLSRLMTGKRLMAISTAKRVAERLKLDDGASLRFVQSAALDQALRLLRNYGVDPGILTRPSGGAAEAAPIF